MPCTPQLFGDRMNISALKLALQARKIEALNSHITFRISQMSKLLEVEAAGRLAGTGVSLTSYRILMIVEIFGEITAADLSRFMVIDRAHISRAATDLIERGMLLVGADRSSKRKKLLSLSEDGQALTDRLHARFSARNAAIEELLTPDELESLWSAIEKITDFTTERIEAS